MGIFSGQNIEELKASKNVKGLIEALKDEDWWVRTCAAGALGEIKDARAVEPLIDALKDKDSEVQNQAAWVLERIGKPAVEPLIRMLKAGDPYIRMRAAEALGNIGDTKAVEPLLEASQWGWGWYSEDEYKFFLGVAAEALGNIGDTRAVEGLIRWLRGGIQSLKRKQRRLLQR